MIPVYQTIIDSGNGNCMQAAIASLLELPLEEVPHFLQIEIETKISAYHHLGQWLLDRGYDYGGTLYNHLNIHEKYKNDPDIRSIMRLKDEKGIKGFFYASVFSPKYFNPNIDNELGQVTHAVIIDRECNIVHDPNPNNKGLKVYPKADQLGYNGVLNVMMIDEK